MKGLAYAKINLGLRVASPRDDGLHPIGSLIQSVDWGDSMELAPAEADTFEVVGSKLPADEGNLAWRAVVALRPRGGGPVRLELEKSIPVAAGLGGGSADAALGLVLAADLFGRSVADAVEAAPDLGADVPFCLAGGTGDVGGIGDEISLRRFEAGYAVAIVVPSFELSTPAVFGRWDELDGPCGPEIAPRDLPTSLRGDAPLINDLIPAAVPLEPMLGDFMSDVQALWGKGVTMSGSGPSVFSFFGTIEEATEAAAAVDGTRASRACLPIDRGWVVESESRLPPGPWTS
jgi:4-diphosphocytidyl-2-C-methyl-D-erythritol kinase